MYGYGRKVKKAAQDTHNGLILDVPEIDEYAAQSSLILLLIVERILKLSAADMALFTEEFANSPIAGLRNVLDSGLKT